MSFVDNPITRISVGFTVVAILLPLILLLLPPIAFPVLFATAITYFLDLLFTLNFILPVRLILSLFYYWILMEFAFLSVKLVLFVYKVMYRSVR